MGATVEASLDRMLGLGLILGTIDTVLPIPKFGQWWIRRYTLFLCFEPLRVVRVLLSSLKEYPLFSGLPNTGFRTFRGFSRLGSLSRRNIPCNIFGQTCKTETHRNKGSHLMLLRYSVLYSVLYRSKYESPQCASSAQWKNGRKSKGLRGGARADSP